ncbi:uncharacterized protein [Linepithema humile]|uniref:uncharacterized protein isoform X1 n=2 Tax=Linepithema humile TaxID=83485 RepID=UPI00351DFBBD
MMDDTNTIVNKDEQYKVIDECMEEETPETTENSQKEVMACPENATQQQSLETSTDTRSLNNDTDKPVPMEVEHNKKDLNNDAIDFTADINLDQLDTQKEVTDEDVMRHLDVIESIELDPETFGMNQSVEEIQCSSQEQDKEEITVIGVEPIKKKWYEIKILEKDAYFKERLSKLSRVLIASYPHYEKWLERIEKIEGTPICKVDEIRRCPLNKPHANRWKFICNEKQIEDVSIKEESNAESFKKTFKTLWCLEPIGVGGVNTNNIDEFPSFVLHAVKIFEDFLQTTITSTQDAVLSIKKEELSTDTDSRKDAAETKQQWMSLLVRCNSRDELMLFATGKDISENAMNRLKQTYESGPGKSCNVKSLYCRTINTYDDSVLTTFLVGAEALDEVVGDLKVQLVPKTNFWSNAAGAWNVVKAVTDLLKPTPKTTILEIGCGIGVIGLSLASKCREVIGVDAPLEINEAELTCQLNSIYNATFIRGSSSEVVNKLGSMRNLHYKNVVTYCIINTGTNMGRAIEVMTCLRKITSLRRIVMITTLTKQSVRAILELARPAESGLGHPFMPVRACVVDTLPTGPHFEAVILMERRLMHRLTQPWFIQMLEKESKTWDNTKALEKIINNDEPESSDVFRKNPLAKTELEKNFKPLPTKKTPSVKSDSSSSGKSKKLKRDHSPEIIELSKKVTKKFEKSGPKPWQQDVTIKKKNWLHENPALRINPLFDKKRENTEQIDLREKLSSNRIDTDLIQKVNESRKILEAAKEKLSGPTTVDATTAKEIKNVLSLVLDQTNKYHTQLPRSVWDRIAPAEIDQKAPSKKELDDDPLLKGRFVQEIRAKDLVITTANKEYLETEDVPKPKFRKYHNLRPLEPDNVMPVALKFVSNDRPKLPKKSFDNRNKQQNQDNSWHKNKDFERNRWNNAEPVRKPTSPMKRQEMPFRHRVQSPNRYSPKRPLLSPPRRPCSPPRRHLSPDRPYQGHSSPSHREYSPQRRKITPPRGPFSSLNVREMSPPRRSTAVSGRSMSPMRRQMSPLRPPLSPSRRQMSMMEYESSKRQMSPTYRLHERSPMRCQMSPERRPMSPVITMIPRSRDMIPPRHQSPMRHFSPPRIQTGRVASPPRRQPSPRRQSSPPNRFADEWDIPSRGAIEQSSTWQRSVNERVPENVWRNERQPTTSGNWPPSSDNDRYHKSTNQEKSWDIRDSSSHGNWGSKQSLAKPAMKESWQTSDNRWSGPSRSGGGGENWNRDKEILGGRKEPWKDTDKPRWEQAQSNNSNWNQGDKDDWNDLPEDARDPWGDESNLGLKERWMNFENQAASSSSGWSREPDKGDPWTKSKDSWQNKSQAFPTKPSCQNIGNPNINETRWLPLNDVNKKSTNWQGGTNTGAWQPSNYSFQSQSQRPFMANLFKDRR